MTTSASRIVFPAAGEVVLESVELPQVRPEQVLVTTRHTMMSIGTG